MAREHERRRAERHVVNVPGELCLSEGRRISVRIVNLGVLGALLQVSDLEEAILEGERAVLEHPLLQEGRPTDEIRHSVGAIVRVELEFAQDGVSRHVAVFFDGGPAPQGATPS